MHTLGNNPTGTNINQNCGSLHPLKASRLVKKKKCDIGICLDGDGDRVIIIDEKGNILNGEEIIFIFAKYYLYENKIKKGSVLVTNEIANHGLDIALKKLGLQLKRVKVGDKNILKEIIDNKYFLAEISNIEKKSRDFSEPEVQEALNAQLSFKNKIDNNTSIIKDISMGALDKDKLTKFASDNKLEIKNYKIESLKQNQIFSEGIIKRIFLIKDGEMDLITNNTLTKSFLILAIKTEYKDLKKDSNDYEKFEAKARLNLINKIYQSHDNNLNEKYKVELNQRTIDRVKNSF